jgi:hypothetical protein
VCQDIYITDENDDAVILVDNCREGPVESIVNRTTAVSLPQSGEDGPSCGYPPVKHGVASCEGAIGDCPGVVGCSTACPQLEV